MCDDLIECKHGNKTRIDAAEEFCYLFVIAMGVGLLEDVPVETRKWLAEPLEKWWEFAHRDGYIQKPILLPEKS